MKFLIFILVLTMSAVSYAEGDFCKGIKDEQDFCKGFEHGHKTGFQQARKSSSTPSSPSCPWEPWRKSGDPESDYEFGYTIGYKKGTYEGSID